MTVRVPNVDDMPDAGVIIVDLSRFDAAPLIAFTATKETEYGTKTDRRIPPRCGAYRIAKKGHAINPHPSRTVAAD
ncbi:MAG: hypothetical protein ABJG55_21085 [Paracoccaceae bacterium]